MQPQIYRPIIRQTTQIIQQIETDSDYLNQDHIRKDYNYRLNKENRVTEELDEITIKWITKR